jgi:hypothetical protein
MHFNNQFSSIAFKCLGCLKEDQITLTKWITYYCYGFRTSLSLSFWPISVLQVNSSIGIDAWFTPKFARLEIIYFIGTFNYPRSLRNMLGLFASSSLSRSALLAIKRLDFIKSAVYTIRVWSSNSSQLLRFSFCCKYHPKSMLPLFIFLHFSTGAQWAPASQCTTKPILCCLTAGYRSNPAIDNVINVLGVPNVGVNTLVGLTCTTIPVVGVGSGATCDAIPLCCAHNDYQGLIGVGKWPLIPVSSHWPTLRLLPGRSQSMR